MSFSFEFTAKTEEAEAAVDAQHAPASVKSFVKDAIRFLPAGLVHVKAQGHLCDGTGSYNVSNCLIEVKPVALYAAPAAAA